MTQLEMFTLDDQPAPAAARARRDDPATSKRAAAKCNVHIGNPGIADAITAILWPRYEATDPQILATLRLQGKTWNESTVRRIRLDMQRAGLVEVADGEGQFTVWRLTELGRNPNSRSRGDE